MTQPNKSTSNSKSFNFPLIDQIERGLRKLKRNEKKENSSETTITPKSSASASEIFEDIEMTTTITILPHPKINGNLRSKAKRTIYAAFMCLFYFFLLLAMIGGLERFYQLLSNYFDDDAERHEILVLDRREMRYKIGNK